MNAKPIVRSVRLLTFVPFPLVLSPFTRAPSPTAFKLHLRMSNKQKKQEQNRELKPAGQPSKIRNAKEQGIETLGAFKLMVVRAKKRVKRAFSFSWRGCPVSGN